MLIFIIIRKGDYMKNRKKNCYIIELIGKFFDLIKEFLKTVVLIFQMILGFIIAQVIFIYLCKRK